MDEKARVAAANKKHRAAVLAFQKDTILEYATAKHVYNRTELDWDEYWEEA